MSLSNPTIRYKTSSTELFSLLESEKKDGDDDDVAVGSDSVRLNLDWRLLPPDVLFGVDMVVMMSSGSADTVVGNSGKADILTGTSVDLWPSVGTMGTVAGGIVGAVVLLNKRGRAVFLECPVVVVLLVVAVIVVVLVFGMT